MSINNQWGALSMRDRAFLIREAVRNGITDIDSIRDTWEHRFDGNQDIIDGGTIPSVVITADSEPTKTPNKHKFSMRDMTYTTDSNHETDSSFMEKLAYSIGSIPSAKHSGEGGLWDIIRGTFNAATGRDPYTYDDLKAFLGYPEDYGFEPLSDTRGPQFDKVISKYKDKNIKTYKGKINPFNEYVVTKEDYDKFFDMATRGEIFYSNADGEYLDYYYKGDPDNSLDKNTVHFINTPHRNDVHDYPIEFVIKDGNLYANAADFYDFSANKGDGLKKRIQSRLLTRYGQPYIIRQNMIPVRAIELPKEFLELPIVDHKGRGYNMDLTGEQKRARNMHGSLEFFESKQ